ncbi:MAG: OmpA family protein, partial [Bacteroidales bacterium]|nr:OmpA family protein [Bacteroidales bacterium]
TLNNITFESNSADLNESSYTELDRVVKLMTDNPGIKIEISAHTDNVGSDAYNLRLSKRRAQSVVQYLLDAGIDQNRLISKGYGESKPLVPNDSDEHKAMNRRVELKILKVENN